MVMLGVVALVAGVSGCGGGDDDEDAAPEPPPTSTSSTVPPPVTPEQVPASACRAAAEDDLDDIALSMTVFDSFVDQGVTATFGSYRYVAGNLIDDGAVVPGPSVWAFDGEVLYAVSENAAEYSSFFPNRDPLVDADDATVAALVACVPPGG